jgi:hypothetical protein
MAEGVPMGTDAFVHKTLDTKADVWVLCATGSCGWRTGGRMAQMPARQRQVSTTRASPPAVTKASAQRAASNYLLRDTCRAKGMAQASG